MPVPFANNEKLLSYVVKRRVTTSNYFFPDGGAQDPYCFDAEKKWRGALKTQEVLKVNLFLLSADLTVGKLNCIQTFPINTPVVFKTSNDGEPTGIALNNGLAYLITPPFPFIDINYQPIFLTWPRAEAGVMELEKVFNSAIKEFKALYALVARQAFFDEFDLNAIRGLF
jgi:hypothetical protein